MAHFTWLNDMKKKAAEEKKEGMRTGNYATTPVRMRYMGIGADGVFQKNMPVEMVQTVNGPRMIHEGEAKVENPNGTVTVIPQKKLAIMGRNAGVKGFAEGGTYTPDLPPVRNDEVINIPKINTPGSNDLPPVKTNDSVNISKINAPQTENVQLPPIISEPVKISQIEAPINNNPRNVHQINAPQTQPLIAPPPVTTIGTVPPQDNSGTNTNTNGGTNTNTNAITTPESIKNAANVNSAESQFRNSAMGRLNAISKGDFSAYNPQMQKQLSDLKSTLDTQDMQARQEMAQNKLNPEAAATRLAMGRATGNQAVANAEANIVNNRLQEQTAATKELAQEARAQMAQEQAKEQFEKTLAQNKEEFEKHYGLSKEQFEQSKKQTEYNQKQEAIAQLLATKDPSNIQQAASMFKEMYPGVSFNTNQLINDIGADRFAQGVKDMATLANTYKSWDEAKSTAAGTQLIKTLGGEAAAKQIFEANQINAIDQEWTAITSSDFYQGLSNEDKTLIESLFTGKLSGSTDFDIVPQFSIRDAKNNLIQNFDNKDDADQYISSHPNQGYTVKAGSRIAPKDSTGSTANATKAVEQPMGKDAEKILENPEDPNFSDVLSARISEMKTSNDYSSLSDSSINDPVYQELLRTATVFDPNDINTGKQYQRTYNNAPKVDELFVYNGQLYQSKGVQNKEVGNRKKDVLSAVNLSTNEPITFTAATGIKGETAPEYIEAKKLIGKIDDPQYIDLVKKSTAFNPQTDVDYVKRDNHSDVKIHVFKKVPHPGYFTVNNKLYFRSNNEASTTRTNSNFYAIDMSTGNKVLIDAAGSWLK